MKKVKLLGLICVIFSLVTFSLITLTGCTEQEWKELICSAEDKSIWLTGYCKITKAGGGGSSETKCKAPRLMSSATTKGECICAPDYPLSIDGQCYSFAERRGQGGTVADCHNYLWKRLDYEDFIEPCIKAFVTKVDQCATLASSWENICIRLFAQTKDECNLVFDNPHEKDLCILKVSARLSDCEGIAVGAEWARCVQKWAQTVEDCDEIDNNSFADWRKLCRQRFGVWD